MAKKTKSSSGSIRIDMSKVTKGGGRRRYPEGDYLVKVTKLEKAEANTGTQQLKVTYEILEGKFKGKDIIDYLALTEKALWRVGNLLDAVGLKWSAKVINLPVEKVVGKVLGVTLVDHEYNNKISSQISDFLDEETARAAIEGEDEDEDEDDEDEEDEDDDDDEDEDLDELDVDEEL